MVQQESATVADAIVEREKIGGEILAVLTPDQQQKLTQIGSEMRSAIDDHLAHLGNGL